MSRRRVDVKTNGRLSLLLAVVCGCLAGARGERAHLHAQWGETLLRRDAELELTATLAALAHHVVPAAELAQAAHERRHVHARLAHQLLHSRLHVHHSQSQVWRLATTITTRQWQEEGRVELAHALEVPHRRRVASNQRRSQLNRCAFF